MMKIMDGMLLFLISHRVHEKSTCLGSARLQIENNFIYATNIVFGNLAICECGWKAGKM